jgi:ABC-type transporter Mla subunit MlaD
MDIEAVIAGLNSLGDSMRAEIADLEQGVLVLDEAVERFRAQQRDAAAARDHAQAA